MIDVIVANPERIALEVLAEVLKPLPPADLLKWAKENIVFSERASPKFPGPYNSERFCYFDEILGALSPDDPCRIVSFSKSAQLGGTVLANIFTLGTMDLRPCDLMYIHPVENNAKKWSKTKLVPMLREVRSLRDQFPLTSRDGSDSVQYKERLDGNGAITIAGSNSPLDLSRLRSGLSTHLSCLSFEGQGAFAA